MLLVGACRVETPLGLRPAVKQPIGGRALRVCIALCLLASLPQIDEFAHRCEPIGTNILSRQRWRDVVISEKTNPAASPTQKITSKLTVSSSVVQYTVG